MECEICNKVKEINTLYYEYAVCDGCWDKHVKGEINIKDSIDINKYKFFDGRMNCNLGAETKIRMRELNRA